MNTLEAAWLAGFLDGEGSLMVTRGQHKGCAAPVYEAVVGATNTDRRLIDRCKMLAGGKIVTAKVKSARWKVAHVWQLRGKNVGPVVEAVLPFLVSKKPQAELLLRLRAITKLGSPAGRFGTRKTAAEVAVRADLYEQVRALNRRGNPVPPVDDYDAQDDASKCFDEAYRAVRERVAAGGPGWTPKQ